MVPRVLLVLVVIVIVYGCGQVSPPLGKAEKGGSAEQPKKIVRLTFDDGPVRGNTPGVIQGTNTPLDGNIPAVLDVLRKYRVEATFFVVGEQARKHPELVRREYSEGHSVENHFYTHPHLPQLTNAEIARDCALPTKPSRKLAFPGRPTFALLTGAPTTRLVAWEPPSV